MNKNLFAVCCDQFNLGTTFIIWSLHYVTDQTEFYSLEKDRVCSIPNNPLRNGTAHSMEINEVKSITKIKDTIDQLKANGNFNHFRFVPKENSLVEYSQQNEKFQEAMATHNIKVVNIGCERLQGLIGFLRYNTEDLSWQNDMKKVKKHCLKYWPSFMENSHIFPNRLNTWHDIRENIAFNIRPYDHWKQWKDKKSTRENVHDCKFKSFLFDPEKEISNILKFLGISPMKRIAQWLEVHHKWLANIGHYIVFCDDIEKIISHILNNQDMDLGKYKMTVLKEAVLLHFLMYKHDLNLHTKVEHLPKNAKDICKLLTKNNRTGIEKLYN